MVSSTVSDRNREKLLDDPRRQKIIRRINGRSHGPGDLFLLDALKLIGNLKTDKQQQKDQIQALRSRVEELEEDLREQKETEGNESE